MFNEEIKKIEESIKCFSGFNKEKKIQRIHKDNMFNKGHSIILSSFDEIKILSNRLGENIEAWVNQESKIQKMPAWQNTKSGQYPDKVQVEMKKADRLMKEVKVDFKALYLFSKIFLDKYAKFLHFINPAEGIRSGTVERFLNSLEESSDPFYKDLKSSLGSTSNEIIEKLTFYRSKKIEHTQISNEGMWFVNDMRGGIAIHHVDRDNGEEVSTISPRELLNLLGDFSVITSSFFIKNKARISKN
jgi:hypothetical protein